MCFLFWWAEELTLGSSIVAPLFFFASGILPFFATTDQEDHEFDQFFPILGDTASALLAKFNSSIIITNDRQNALSIIQTYKLCGDMNQRNCRLWLDNLRSVGHAFATFSNSRPSSSRMLSFGSPNQERTWIPLFFCSWKFLSKLSTRITLERSLPTLERSLTRPSYSLTACWRYNLMAIPGRCSMIESA